MQQKQTALNRFKKLFRRKNIINNSKLIAVFFVLLGATVFSLGFLYSPQRFAQASNNNSVQIDTGIVLNGSGTKRYVAENNNIKVFDVATNKIERIAYDKYLIRAITLSDNKLFAISERLSVSLFPTIRNDDNVKTLKIYDSTTLELLQELPATSVFDSTIGLKVINLRVSPDSSKLYISIENVSDRPFVGLAGSTPSLIVIDLQTLERSQTVINTPYGSPIKEFSSDGKKIILLDYNNANIELDTLLVNSTDISTFTCTPLTSTLGSTVTCTVNTLSNVIGLAKFQVGLESCTAYFPAAGSNTASCSYTANNIQTSPVTINPSFGAPLTNGTVSITGLANDVTIAASNITPNNNCTVTGNVKINSLFDCSFNLTGSSSNSYVLPTNGIKVGVSGISTKSDSCTLLENGTINVKLNCKNIPSVGGTAGNKNVQAFINNSTTANNSGTINLTDGLLVNSTLDTVDAIPGDGYCGDVNGVCTLRAAVMEANAIFDKDKITIPAGVYQLTIPPTDTPVNPLSSEQNGENKGSIDGDLDVTSDIDFIGSGKDTTFIQAGTDNTNGIDRVFHIFNTNVNFNDLTVRYGRANNVVVPQYVAYTIPGEFIFEPIIKDQLPQNGGGIYYQKYNDFNFAPENALLIQGNEFFNVGNVTLTDAQGGKTYETETTFNLNNVKVSDSFAGNSGGGVYNSAMFSTFTNVEISNNVSGKFGGGVSRAGVADRQAMEVSGFVAIPAQLVETSGLRFIKQKPGDPTIDKDTFNLKNTLISSNQSADGGGLYHDRARKIFVEEDTQILSNVATIRGGGIYNAESIFASGGQSTITITGANINSNIAVEGGGVYNESGHVETLPGNLTGRNTTLQDNKGEKGSAWFTLSGLSEATNTSIYNSNNTNPNYDYNSARIQTTVFRIEAGDLKIKNSMLLGNWGRGIELNGGKLFMDSSTIADNSGRGISASNGANPPDSGDIRVENSTFTRINAPAIYLGNDRTIFYATHLTIYDNTYGLSINEDSLPTINLFDNSIVAKSFFKNCVNTAGSDLTLNVGGGRGKNLSDNADCNLVNGFTTNAAVATTLGPLQFNGGPTVTIALLPGSPAIDGGAGSTTYDGRPPSPLTDQRGLPRPSGINYDVGAFETEAAIVARAVNDTASTPSDTPVDINVTTNDIGGEFGIDLNQVVDDNSPNYGDISYVGNGTFRYTPNLSYLQGATINPDNTITDTFTYYFVDNDGTQSNTATVTITINLVPPQAENDDFSTSSDASVDFDVLSNDIGGTFGINVNSLSTIDLPTKGDLVDNGSGNYTYTPDPLQFPTTGTDSFTYTFADGNGTVSNTATVTITVDVAIITPQPIANPDTITTPESTPITIDVLTNDVNSTNICVGSITGLTNGTAVITNVSGNDRILFTPTVGYFGTTSFTYTACSTVAGTNPSTPATVSVVVTENTAPVANPDTAAGNKNNPIVINVPLNDTDSNGTLDLTSVVITNQPGKGSVAVNPTTGIVTYTPNIANYTSSGSDTFGYTIRDNKGKVSNIGIVVVNITVTPPVTNSDTALVNSNNPVTVNVLANDTNATSICTGSVIGATNGIAVISGTQIIYTPNNNYTGSDSFTYRACNSDGQSASTNVNVTVNNIPPVAVNDTITLAAFSQAVVDVAANDTDSEGNSNLNRASIAITVQPVNGTVTVNTTSASPDFGKVTYTPTNSTLTSPYSDTFSYTINDSGNPARTSSPATVQVLYTPVATGDTVTTNQNVPVTINVLSNDIAADTICDSGANNFTNPANGSLVISSDKKTFIYTPSNNSVGADSFTYKTCNPNGSSSFATANITINPVIVTPQPVANPDTISTPESTPITINVLANDVNSTNICVGSITGLTNGTATITSVSGTDRILFTPTTGYFGTTTFTYTACSTVAGTNPSAPATISVNVTAVNPIAVNDTATTNENENITINILANDSDPSGQTLTICSPLSTSTNGTITKTTVNNIEQIIFTPTTGYFGTTSFTYTACDPAGNPSNVATVSVVVAQRVIQNIQLSLFKSRPDDQILVNDPIKIQADIRNPNNFVVEKIETIIRIDTTKLRLVPNSLREGTISGNKFAGILNNRLSISTYAQPATTTTFQAVSDSELKVTILNAAANQTIPVVFDVIPQATLENSIQGTSNIINTQTNQPIATSNAQVTLQASQLPQILTNILVRTGGSRPSQILVIFSIVALVFLYSSTRSSKVE